MKLLIGAAVARCAASAIFGHHEPWAQAGLGAVIVAGIVTAFPIIRMPAPGMPWNEAWALMRRRKFLVPFLATVSVILALALFTNADRVIAQGEFDMANATNFGYINLTSLTITRRPDCSGARCFGARCRCSLFFTRNGLPFPAPRTRRCDFFWIYLGALLGGTFLLAFLAPVLSWLFTGNPFGVGRFIPGFIGGMLMMGLVQGMAVFALASRRYLECFTLGGCSIAYTILLSLFGHEPQLMTSCIFGGGTISLMIVLLLGVTRYARSHP